MLNSRMGFSRTEPFSGGRGSNKDDVRSGDYKVLDATIAQDTDGSYNMKTSPGFEEWKNRKHSQYSKNDYGRSVKFVSLLISALTLLFEN
jgi:hypothetical protein